MRISKFTHSEKVRIVLESLIAEAFEDYNHSRIHSSLGYVTPDEFLTMGDET